jgi:lysophospholipase L1-like esterase
VSKRKTWRRLKRRVRKSRRIQVTFVAVTSAALLVFLIWAFQADDPQGSRIEDRSSLAPEPDDGPPQVLVIGDSMTSGTDENAPGYEWEFVLGDQLGWQVTADGVPGSGYLQDGYGERFISRITDDSARIDPDLVILAGGANDVYHHRDLDEISLAVELTIERTEQAFPEARILLFSPWSSGAPSTETLALTDAMKSIAREQQIDFIDVTWYLSGDPALIGRDGRHPNNDGHRIIALRVAEEGVIRALVSQLD